MEEKIEVELSPGWHQLQLSGGFWYDGKCDHCCWDHDFPFEVQLGLGSHTHRTDATDIPGGIFLSNGGV